MTGVAERILAELRRYGADPRSMFEPAVRGGWLWTGPGGDYSYVTSEERGHIIRVIENERI